MATRERDLWQVYNDKGKRKVIGMQDELQRVVDNSEEFAGHRVILQTPIGPKSADQAEAWTKFNRSKERLDNHAEDNGGFVFLFYENRNYLAMRYPELTPADTARLLYLATYVGYGTTRLEHDNGRPITRRQFAELTRLSASRHSDFVTKMSRNNILRVSNNAVHLLEPIFYKGSVKEAPMSSGEARHIRLYIKTMRDLFENIDARSIGRLALIYDVLPFVHFEHNILTRNPDEENFDDVVPMSLGELADHLGFSGAKRMRSALVAARYGDLKVFGIFDDGADARRRKVVVNPKVIYASNSANGLKSLELLFR